MSTLSIQPVVLFLHVGVKVLPFGTSLDVLPGEKSNHTPTSLIIQGWVFDGFFFHQLYDECKWDSSSLDLAFFVFNFFHAERSLPIFHSHPPISVLNSAVTLSFSALGSEIVSKPATRFRWGCWDAELFNNPSTTGR